jgi:hypothetical protein
MTTTSQNNLESLDGGSNGGDKVITEQLGPTSSDNIVILKYGPDLMDELYGLSQGNHLFEAVVIDATLTGFLFPAELLIEGSQLVDALVEVRGALIFLRTDSAAALIKESVTSPPSFRVFNSYNQLFDFSPSLTKYIRSTLGKSAGFQEESTDLSEQILNSAIPVLTDKGMEEKVSISVGSSENHVIALIDNYSPVASLALRSNGRLSEDEVLEVLKELERRQTIFPLFPKIPFLANCFKNQRSFSIEDYLTGCKILPQSVIDELTLELTGTNMKERMSLGALAVKRGILNFRQLEVALQDQAFYGQQKGGRNKVGSAATDEHRVQSLVGHLGSTDPMSLLQNMATNRETGVLSVENRDMQFKCHFELGKPMHARIGKLHGNEAIVEFASAWTQGIFVFIKRKPSEDLTKDTCKVSKALEKCLLDAALAQDNTDVVWKKLPKGPDSVLEKNEEKKGLLEGEPLKDPKEKTPLKEKHMKIVKSVYNALDGLTPIARVIRNIGDVTTADVAYALDILLENHMATVPEGDLSGPMQKFQRLVLGIHQHIGGERNSAFLRLSLRDTLGYTGRARVFILSPKGEVGINMAAARQAGTSLSMVVSDLENWQVKYIEYVSQDLDRAALLSIIREVHDKS